jgi:predicted nucleic acid-binding protein
MKAVINASPLIFLSKINRLNVLDEIFDTLYIPKAVSEEIQAVGKEQVKISNLSFELLEIFNKTAVAGLLGRLHIGEAEVIIGAIEKNIDTVILDEISARNKAKQLGLKPTGTLGILLKSQSLGILTDIEAEIKKLKDAGMYVSDSLINKILNLNL